MKFEDGSGKGYGAKVDKNNRVHTQAVTESEAIHSVGDGTAYNINTGLISITGDATLQYIKNNEDEELFIEAIAIGSFEGICHSDDPYITIVRNPTGGDLICDATAVSMNQNRNFGSNKALLADNFKGKVGGTLTGGADLGILQVTPGGRSFYTINLSLPKGASMGIKLTANRSSGTANYYCALIVHLKDPENV
jgi:hypothetical protein